MRQWIRMILVVLFSAIALAETDAVLLQDDFSGLPHGLLFDVVGAELEYQYLPIAAPVGHWTVSTFRSDPPSQRAWRAINENGKHYVAQTFLNKAKDYHMVLSAGDPAWTDYSVTLEFIPGEGSGWSGVSFRHQNDRCHYFAGLDKDRFILARTHQGTAFRKLDVAVLAETAYTATPGQTLRLEVSARGAALRARIVDGPVLEAEDTTFPQGRIALMADRPTKYASIRVGTTPETAQAIQGAIAARDAKETELQAGNPKMTLWKKFAIKDYGVGRNVRFGDLNGDGVIDLLFGQVVHHGPKDQASELCSLTAVTLDGEILWQTGAPDVWKSHLTNDVAFQIHDIDGDGRNDVVYCMNAELVIADGATGTVKRKIPTPATPANTPAPYNKVPKLLGDSLFFCDLRGTGRDADLIVKDRYTNYWAYSGDLEPLWQGQCKTGHYPFAADIDHDGKDEVAIGYSMLDHDGKVLWSHDDALEDHDDGVAVVSLRPEDPPKVICSASDEGLVILDTAGNIEKHLWLGHVQNPSIGNFRPDLPGLELVTANFWGNQGIFHFFDADLNLYHDMEPGPHASLSLPVNWRGDGAEFFVLSANPDRGGLHDGWGRCAVRFPADGHPDMCYNVLDLTGDCRDEIVVWDPYEVWVYTQEDNPKTGRLYRPVRNPLYTESNYRAAVSLPGWNDLKTYTPIDVSLFQDSINHWKNKYGRDRKDARYLPSQIAEIANNLLPYQNADGGWPKNLDWLAIIDPQEVRALYGKVLERSTLDNRNTYAQVQYLAKAFQQTGDERYRAAAQRGLDYIVREQRPTGGWRGADVDAITFNDDVMTGVMTLLLEIRRDAAHFAWLDSARREALSKALDKAITCTLSCQIQANGKKTAWCQQHDHTTFAPIKARAYELPSICAAESTGVLRFLMSLPDPTPQVKEAIAAGMEWLKSVSIKGIRIETREIPPERFENYTSTTDHVVVPDANAEPLWARFYEIENNQPLFCRRDGTKVATLAEVDPERRNGYAWYGAWPRQLLDRDYPKWQKRLEETKKL